jgi:hypothetical protein
MSSNLLVKSHLVAGVERLAPACATRSSHAVAGPGRNSDFAVAKLGFGSTVWILQCGNVQPPD